MEQTSAQRRLVKSPPELWAKLSDEVTLASHLAEFGEIRITRVEPETTVAWEGDRASGTVELEPTGWGTRVVLTATPAAPEEAAVEAEPAPPPPPERSFVPPAPVEEMRPAPAVVEEVGPTPAVVEEQPPPAAALPSAAVVEAAPSALQGLWARLFKRSKEPEPSAEIPAPPAPSPDPSPPVPTPDPSPPPGPPAPGPTPVPDPQPPAPPPDPPPPVIGPPAPHGLPPAAAEAPPPAEPLDPERAFAVLTGVLDELGAAHHRPFSRE